MNMRLQGKHVVLGVTAGIAAYKTPALVRLLVAEGAQVRVCMTSSAHRFVTPMTLQAVSGNPVATDQFTPQQDDAMDHISLARWADVILIAPATANAIAKLALGIADDLLGCMCLASDSYKCMAPAMNRVMWKQAQVQRNLQSLRNDGWSVFPVEVGLQACGESGEGRMLGLEDIVSFVVELLTVKLKISSTLAAKKVCITAGPTREAIDPVRYITNHSSGKMGYALASVALAAGAEVRLISGPVNLLPPSGAELVMVESAQEMYQAVMQTHRQCDIFIACAAVADYRPKQPAEQKIKKRAQAVAIDLEKTPDILADFSANKQPHQLVIGFAAETQKLTENARKKLNRKKLDMIVANQVGTSTSGFDSDYNQAVLLTDTFERNLGTMDKTALAGEIIEAIADLNDHRRKATRF